MLETLVVKSKDLKKEDVAQLVRVLACHAKGRGFNSRRSRKKEFALAFALEIQFLVFPMETPVQRT